MKRLSLVMLLALPALGVAPSQGFGIPDFKGYTEGAWPQQQTVSADRITDVGEVPSWSVAPTSMRVVLRPGDKPISSDGDRSEVLADTSGLRTPDGGEFYLDAGYRFSSGWPSGDWQINTQAHLPTAGTQPTVIVSSDGGRLKIKTSSGGAHTGKCSVPLVTNHWYRVSIHGFVDNVARPFTAIIDGSTCFDGMAVTGNGNYVYWKAGYYSGNNVSNPNAPVLIHGLRIAPTPIGQFVSGPSPGDSTPPTAAWGSAPADRATVAGIVNPLVSASDASGIDGVSWFVDGVAWPTAQSPPVSQELSAPYGDGPYDTAAFRDGVHVVTAKVFDKANPQNVTTLSRTWTFDNVPGPPADTAAPVPTFSSPAAGSFQPGPFTISATATDNAAASTDVSIYRNDGHGELLIGSCRDLRNGTVCSASDNGSRYAPGTALTYRVTATDPSANVGEALREVTAGPAPQPNRRPTGVDFTWSTPVVHGRPTTFTAAATDPDGDAITFSWDITHETAASDGFETPAANPATFTYQRTGAKTVYLKACDSRGACAPVVSHTFTAS